ncbi:hypothetical protein TNCV_1665181 [Trichonephila clavipes]|nr:hypothetical protein TNCV_1665181 [Trichonephila clavipes]
MISIFQSSTLPHLNNAVNEFFSFRTPPRTPEPECCLAHSSLPVEKVLTIRDASSKASILFLRPEKSEGSDVE